MLKRIKLGQTSLEYAVLIIIVLGAFIAMQNYIKRGIQGRFKESVDTLGDQYDPRFAESNVRHTLSSSTNTVILALNTEDGLTTIRTDTTTMQERKTGSESVQGY